jgi:hypothetical protein
MINLFTGSENKLHENLQNTGTPVSSTNKTDHHDITEILLKVALNTIKQTNIL